MRADDRVLMVALWTAVSPLAGATPVEVTQSVPIERNVAPALRTVNATLAEILTTASQTGTAIVQASDKQVAAMTEVARAQREADIFGRQTDRLERARESFTVADSICSESASGQASEVGRQTRAAASRLAGGAGIQSDAVRKAVAAWPAAPREGGTLSAQLHAGYCTAEEAARYGGTALCPQVSALPGGDIELRSLLDGAGAPGKPPALTFTPAQVDAAMAYMKNSARHDAGAALGKGEGLTTTGREYQGLLTQYRAIQSAASQPQLEMIAASQPNPATREALAEALQSPSAHQYFSTTASETARRDSVMSEREFEAFEVGRRYANTAWGTDLQGMQGDNLLRELIRVQSLGNWLQWGVKNELRTANILAGQQLALAAKAQYAPQLQQLSVQMNEGARGSGK